MLVRTVVGPSLPGDIYTGLDTDLDTPEEQGWGSWALGTSCPSRSHGWLPRWRDHNPSEQPIPGTLCDQPHCKKKPKSLEASLCLLLLVLSLGSTGKSLAPSSFPPIRQVYKEILQNIPVLPHAAPAPWHCFYPFLDSKCHVLLTRGSLSLARMLHPHFMEGRAPPSLHLPSQRALVHLDPPGRDVTAASLTQCHH